MPDLPTLSASDSVKDMVDTIGGLAVRHRGEYACGFVCVDHARAQLPQLAVPLPWRRPRRAGRLLEQHRHGRGQRRRARRPSSSLSMSRSSATCCRPSCRSSTSDSTGSGVVYDTSGDIVTNEHVIGTATTVKVQESVGNKTLMAKVVGEFAPDDLAVIRVENDASSLKPARFANSDDAQIGEIVLAMGNPLGLTDSVTQGIISATGRTVGSGEPGGGKALITAAIQTSAAINPGNSGGALVAPRRPGRRRADARGPAARARAAQRRASGSRSQRHRAEHRRPADQDRQGDQSDRATLGITAQTAASAQGSRPASRCSAVDSGGTRRTAGVKAGDTIVGVNDQRVTALEELETMLATSAGHQGDDPVHPRQQRRRSGPAAAKLGTLGSS